MFLLSRQLLNVKIANYSFLLLFPGFFFYHYMLGAGIISPFLGGLFGIVSISIIFPILVVNLSFNYKKQEIITSLFFLFIILSLLISIANYSLGIPAHFTYETLNWHLIILYFNLVMFYLGRFVDVDFIGKLCLPILFLLFLIIIFNLSNGMFNAKSNAGDAYKLVSTYQGFARSILMVAFVTIAYFNKKLNILCLIYLLVFTMLFLNGARTEFLIFNISLFLCVLLYSLFSFKKIIIFLVLSLLLSYSIINILEYLPNNRVLDIILNLDNALNSGSESIRWEIINDTLNKIEDSIFFGNYGFYTQYGGPSYFPHNFITVWINYGFLGFVLFFTIVVYMWFFAICNLKKFTGKCFVLFLVFMLVLIFFTISIIVSKHHLYIMFGFTVGVYSQLKHESRTPRIIQ